MDCSPPGPSIRGIFQARVLEWGAIAFSDIYHITYLFNSNVRKQELELEMEQQTGSK